PAQEVGGDFYYVLDGQVVVAGDVSGKGLKAAMVVSLLVGVLRETRERAPGALLRALNRALAGQMEGGFVTCCCVRLTGEGKVTAACAGQMGP
ncbi:MAG: SpoIIE family protein phosphatase, partial [Chloroflexi bacterium]|nr:SpoIIE family protein phosphatase [Chloroflexota bacterium]